jgi:hypothetical protein
MGGDTPADLQSEALRKNDERRTVMKSAAMVADGRH